MGCTAHRNLHMSGNRRRKFFTHPFAVKFTEYFAAE